LGALGALAQSDLKRLAAFLVVSGIGAMLVGIGLGTAAGVSGAIVYAVHSMLAMTALFVLFGTMETVLGIKDLNHGGGVYAAFPMVAVFGLAVVLAVSGLPPFSGFWPKFMLVDAAFERGDGIAVLGAVGVIVTGILTTIVMGRAWVLTVLKPSDGQDGAPIAADGSIGGKMGTLGLLVFLLLGLGLFPSMVVPAADVGAAGLLDPTLYTERVLGMREGG
ncbi:MAG: proton-conducting transporter membrane subunit, partial [Pseudomonadota bacterium]